MRNALYTLLILVGIFSLAWPYTVIISTNPTVEQQFLSALSAQFSVSISSNPYYANTYLVNLFGPNPNYVLPGQVLPSVPCQLDKDVALMVGISSFTYPYGWAAGMYYERCQDLAILSNYFVNCSSMTTFQHVMGSTGTWDLGTCDDVLLNADETIFQRNLSTPTLVPGF
jgi:hypothetical protein